MSVLLTVNSVSHNPARSSWMCAVAPSGECLRGESPPDRMLATPRRRLCLATLGLSLVVAVLRVSVGTSYM